MIQTLHIKNIGIIEDLNIDFNTGFNVLTGETGAGKTLIIEAIQIICGSRFSKDIIKKDKDFSLVEACIYAPKSEYAEDENIIVSREINKNGKNLCKVNGRLVTITELKKIMQDNIDIHGQNNNQNLMNPAKHIEYLDSYIGKEIDMLKEKYTVIYTRYLEINKALDKNYGNDIEKQRKLDLLMYQFNEIDEAYLKEGEEETLEEKFKIAKDSAKIIENLTCLNENLEDKVISGLEDSIKSLNKLTTYNNTYVEKLNKVEEMYYELKEISSDVYGYKQEVDIDEEALNTLQNRLDQIFSLKRKYGNTVTDILKYKQEIEDEINSIENLEYHNNELKKELGQIKIKMLEQAKEINKVRTKFAEELQKKINNELIELDMKNAKFEVNITYSEEEEFTKNALDKIEFRIATNLGEEFKPLVKIASGGEVSRIMLGIKTVLASALNVEVLVFDEIDTGISGVAAKAVSKKMRQISKKHQVICVTHQAVIAAKADFNYFIQKNIVDNITKTSVRLLSEIEVIREIARIATGDINKIALEHAASLREDKSIETI
ncbi:MAG: DNA repair protein RecN [Clostridia bacterium]